MSNRRVKKLDKANTYTDDLVSRIRELGKGANQTINSGICSGTVAVLFADIVGFTTLAERITPERSINLLRQFHGRMTHAVEIHSGSVNQYIGDSIMAVFVKDRPATNALMCAYFMFGILKQWNKRRRMVGSSPINIGIGVHIGDVAMGEIGNDHHRQYSVVGDTVNVAQRLEALTRKAVFPLLVSRAVVDSIRRETNDRKRHQLGRFGTFTVPGRAGQIEIWGSKAELDGMENSAADIAKCRFETEPNKGGLNPYRLGRPVM